MATSGGGNVRDEDCSLSSMFAKGLAMHEAAVRSEDDPCGDRFQHRVRAAILLLEDVTRMVSALDVFSRNEHHSDLSTDSIKYLLLPALLGDLNAKLDEDHSRRLELIRIVETYYMDFLTRAKEYGIIEHELPRVEEEPQEETMSLPGVPSSSQLALLNLDREAKVRRFKERKELQSQLEGLKACVDPDNDHRDEEQVRKYYVKLVRSFALSCLDELSSYRAERPILAHMAKVRRGEAPRPEEVAAANRRSRPARPLKPVVITKDRIQKEVFGMGYKNLPVLTIEEFYEQRVREGWFPDPAEGGGGGGGGSLMDRASSGQGLQREQEEEEERTKEEKEDRDDADELERKRAMDEYRDDHKRGEGNRHNKG